MKKQNPIILKIALIATILINIILIVSILISNLGVLRFNYDVLYNGAICYCDNHNITIEDEYNPFGITKFPYDDESAPKEFTVTFNGKTYSGTYEQTEVEDYIPYLIYHYECNDGSDCKKFMINADTKEIVNISFKNNDTPAKEIDIAACQKIADDIADDYIKLSDYVSSISFISSTDSYCDFTYSRNIDGFETPESIKIRIGAQGNLIQLSLISAGEFKNINQVNFNEKKALEAIRNKLNNMGVNDDNWIEFNIVTTKLVKLTNGKVAINCSVRFKNKGEQSGHHYNFLVT
ncbi:MAG: hypothetical protein IKL40_06640 [Clostridia bacterium]|nr:hypothetical protein [Clostridia bacterium]